MERVAVLLGGKSAERAVSLQTGAAVAAALRRSDFDVVEVDVGPGVAADLSRAAPDKVFVALHGRWGEDGTVQGLLEMLELPYTGSGVLASALAMDKGLSKTLFQQHGVPTPEFEQVAPGAVPHLEPPLVLKPLREGSTLGISVVTTSAQLQPALAAARRYSSAVLAERWIGGREVTLAVLDGEPLPLVEIVPASGFYDYAAKYTAGATEYRCPAPLPKAWSAAARAAGLAAYRCLGCEGGARSDLIIDPEGRPWVLEVNTIPGMTPTSLLPKAAAAAGIEFDALVARMVAGARLRA